MLLMLSDLIINSLKNDIILSSFGIIIFYDSWENDYDDKTLFKNSVSSFYE